MTTTFPNQLPERAKRAVLDDPRFNVGKRERAEIWAHRVGMLICLIFAFVAYRGHVAAEQRAASNYILKTWLMQPDGSILSGATSDSQTPIDFYEANLNAKLLSFADHCFSKRYETILSDQVGCTSLLSDTLQQKWALEGFIRDDKRGGQEEIDEFLDKRQEHPQYFVPVQHRPVRHLQTLSTLFPRSPQNAAIVYETRVHGHLINWDAGPSQLQNEAADTEDAPYKQRVRLELEWQLLNDVEYRAKLKLDPEYDVLNPMRLRIIRYDLFLEDR